MMNLTCPLPLLILSMFGVTLPDTTPRLVQRPEMHYAAIRTHITLKNFGSKAPTLWPKVRKWLAARGIEPSGPPMVRYLVIDMAKDLEIEVGFPVSKAVKGDGQVLGGSLPAGRYVEMVHKGSYDGMIPANAALQEWAKKQGLMWKIKQNRWGGRVEFNRVDPGDTRDSSRWETQILYQVN